MKYTFKIAEIATKPEKAIELVNQINNICDSNAKLRNIVYNSTEEYNSFDSINKILPVISMKYQKLNNSNLSIIIEPIL